MKKLKTTNTDKMKKSTKPEAELLNLLLEENSEVIQAVSKIFRFGWESCHPDTPNFTNKDHLEEEIGDLLCIIKLLCDKGIVDQTAISRYAEFKIEKLRKFSNVKLD